MIKMHQLFLRTIVPLFSFLLLSICFTTYFWSKHIYIQQIEENLSQNITVLSSLVMNTTNLDEKVKKLKESLKLRITIIDNNGLVIAESDKNKNLMENHLNRYEVTRANKLGIGSKIRYSNTLNKELLYVAKKVKINGSTYYIRMAAYIEEISQNFIYLSFQIFTIVSIFLIIAFFITYRISKRIKIETNNILNFLVDLSNKRNKNKIKSDFTLEFHTITRYLNTMSNRLSKRDKQKSKQNAKLKLSNRQKDEIISAISHEFKNPIAIISGYTQTILEDENLPLEIKNKFLHKINTNANKMTAIIDTLRLSLQLEEGKQKLTFKNNNIKKMCIEIISDLEAKYKHRKIIIKGNELELEVDEILFNIVLSNIIENALKYSEDKIIISLDKNEIIIEDFGIGISEKDINLITSKFYRVSHNTWNNSLGLGLFIVNNIIRIHKFNLEIKSDISIGSKFIIKFKN
ncbi:MAG: sensor histidine kinase [Campylobacteraceae bacterium]|nr:sensor histidine kinase [Campylobacteraceae bacterium]